ncbi:MAG: hypothetical protein JOZ96_19855 [Acidobacteria bacterium]|nr:hypothetical protein [Acidobacteriota bacterium]
MPRRVVNVESRAYLFSPDEQPAPALRNWALVRARVIDELTGEPPLEQMKVETDRAELLARAAAGGLVGLVGTPLRAFPKLAMQDYEVGLTVGARGFVRLRKTVKVLKNVNFPAQFAPADAGTLALHREPVTITGRTVLAAAGTTTPVANATVRVEGVWPTMPPANVFVPPEAPNLVSLLPPTYFERPAAAATLQRREMTPVVGQDKLLLDHTPAGSSKLHVSDRVGLTPGDIIAVDEADPERTEFLVVQALTGASTDVQPARITLKYPTAHAHAPGAVVREVTPQPAGGNNQLKRPAIAGDTTVFLDTMSDLGAAHVVELTGGAGPAEYHLVRRLTAKSNADGYYRLPPLARVAQVKLRADDGGAHADINLTAAPDYGGGVYRLDFVFR